MLGGFHTEKGYYATCVFVCLLFRNVSLGMLTWCIFSEPMQMSWQSYNYSITNGKGTGLAPLGAGEMLKVSP